jgi:hypothetical protein
MRVGLWILLVAYALLTYVTGPHIERFVLDRVNEFPTAGAMALRTAHYVNVYFIFWAILVVIDGALVLVLPRTGAAATAGRIWSRLMWVPPVVLHATILIGELIGVFQFVVQLATK